MFGIFKKKEVKKVESFPKGFTVDFPKSHNNPEDAAALYYKIKKIREDVLLKNYNKETYSLFSCCPITYLSANWYSLETLFQAMQNDINSLYEIEFIKGDIINYIVNEKKLSPKEYKITELENGSLKVEKDHLKTIEIVFYRDYTKIYKKKRNISTKVMKEIKQLEKELLKLEEKYKNV